MPEITPEPVATTEPEPEITPQPVVEAEPAISETAPADEWQDKYQGQLKVNRDLEKKLSAERKAREALELANAPAEEQAAARARADLTAEVTQKANARILKSELRAAATGKLADPADAALFIDLSAFEVSDDGEVNADALTEAIDDLITRKPHLAAGKQTRFDGAADQGARTDSKPQQLTEVDVERMRAAGDDEGIVKARAEGRLNTVLGITT